MSSILNALVGALDIVVLRPHPQGNFQLASAATEWFQAIWSPPANGPVALVGKSDFLDFFLAEAVDHWRSGEPGRHKSGPFIEVLNGQEIALEATALMLEGMPVLLIENLGDTYQQNVSMLQSARNNLLTQEQLELEVSRRTQDIRNREFEIASRLIYAAGFRDEETGAHIKRIGLYSAEMAEALGWSAYDIDDIHAAAPMHDIGKIGIPDQILKKPGRLTPDEFTIMKDHARIGMEILDESDVPMLKMAADIAGFHHEYWDGSGYPHGRSGEDIPQSARIVAIVDVYDALVHKRVYKPAIAEERALDMMSKLSGIQFEPMLFEVFMDNIDVMRDIRTEIQD